MSAAAAAPPVLQARDLAVGYAARGTRCAVLERVNLTAQAGELICLLGPNGIGKSTLLRTLARMQPPLWGAVEVGGQPLASLPARELARHLGIVLTERVSVESLSVRAIVELGRYPHSGWHGWLSARDRAVAQWAIDAVGAGHLAARDINRLSDGERQRVMVARALAQQPLLLVLDEPTAFLDAPSRVELMGLLRRLTRDGAFGDESRNLPPLPGERGQGVRGAPAATPLTVVVSTHDIELALRSADVVWLLLPGGELATGAPEDVIVSGGVAQAFEGRQFRFHAEERSFRWLTGERGSAQVRGDGLPAAMARALLEREGFTVERGAPGIGSNGHGAASPLTVDVTESGWRLPARNVRGDTFRSLAAHVRAWRSPSTEEENGS